MHLLEKLINICYGYAGNSLMYNQFIVNIALLLTAI